ncbi:MAG: alpha/beta hydrolase [Pyrinomonadaceae bacterium]
MFRKFIFVAFLIAIVGISGFAQTESPKPTPEMPKPDIADGKYGEFSANTFDLWKAKSKKPTPLVVYMHSGGLASGDKSNISANQLTLMLRSGLSVMAINYRLTGAAVFPQHFMDCARAIQFARHNAKEFNIDPKLIAGNGGSAGGMAALWIGFHDDMADPSSDDPVLRQSTRLKVMTVSGAQTTLIPDQVIKYVGELATQYGNYSNGKLFGLNKNEMNTPKALELYRAISPLTYLSKDDPQVWAYYSVPKKPLTSESTTSDAIHHPGFGVVLKQEMDKLGITCKLRHKDDGQKVNDDMIQFMQKYLK